LAERLGPSWLVWENVPGVLSSNEGRDFGAFLGALEELGYGWAYRTLDAQHFGVAQRRRRVFVVGCADGQWQRAAAVLFERESMSGHPPPSREARADVAGAIADGTGERGYRNDLDTSGAFVPTMLDGYNMLTERHTAPSLSVDVHHNRQILGPIPVDLAQVTSASNPSNRSNRSNPAPGDPSYTLASTSRPAVAYNARQDPVHSIHSTPPLDTDGQSVAVGARRLTPVEWERLQGFPDDHTLVPYRGKLAKDGPRYRAIGNSMAVPVMRWLGERIVFTARTAPS